MKNRKYKAAEGAMRYGHLFMSLFCAWVLWEEKAFLMETTSRDQTDILGSAYASRDDCDATLQRFIREDLARGNTMMNPQVLELRSEDGKLTIITSYRCLPDTMDPRAPKAGK